MFTLPWPLPDPEIRDVLASAWADGSWGRYDGPHLDRLVQALAELHGVEHVFPCSSGTFAVELALRALDVGPGDEVILAGYDFPGNFRAIEAVGARPVLIDLKPGTAHLDEEQIEAAASAQTKSVIVSHLHGSLAPMRKICEIAKSLHLVVVEDACQSTGARVDGRIAGSWGDVGVLSFGGSKLLTAGRGGAIMTQREEILQRAKIFCLRGNHAFPLSELQAAVLLPQVKTLASQNAQRADNVQLLVRTLQEVAALSPVVSSFETNNSGADCPSFYKVGWRWNSQACAGKSRECAG
jgi:dTDP-4-amino-4,6-dideoxygalactose transaminase